MRSIFGRLKSGRIIKVGHTIEAPDDSAYEELKLDIFVKYMDFRIRKDTKGQTLDYPLRLFPRFAEVEEIFRLRGGVFLALKDDMFNWRFKWAPDGNGSIEIILRKDIQVVVNPRTPSRVPNVVSAFAAVPQPA